MNLARFVTEERVDLHLDDAFDEADNPATHEGLVRHMAGLIETSPDVVNATKLCNDLVFRERRAPSMMGQGVAMPHVRTLQARKLIMAVAIGHDGLDLDTPDGEPVRLVISFVGPPYDDKLYLLVYKRLGERLEQKGWIEGVLEAELSGEVLRALSS